MNNDRYSRQVQFFGKAGQVKLFNNRAVIVGVGGIGSHIAQQLAFLGVGKIALIDDDLLEDTNLNRLIGVNGSDPIGMPKVDIVSRNILSINPRIKVMKVPHLFFTKSGFKELKKATIVFGCIDNDAARLILNEFCLAYDLPYIDVASDIMMDGSEYGGRVISVFDNTGCLYCWDEIDKEEAGVELENSAARKDRDAIYGVRKNALQKSGPSVVSINGVVASMAVTEFMLYSTGKRGANYFLNYSGSRGIVNKRTKAESDCYYCKAVRGTGDRANLFRYLKPEHEKLKANKNHRSLHSDG